jgi:hypothetical protein
MMESFAERNCAGSLDVARKAWVRCVLQEKKKENSFAQC